MSGTVMYNVFSQTDVRFCVVGWNADENIVHADKVETLRQYAGTAASSGLSEEEISADILDGGDALFEGVDVSFIKRDGKRPMVSIVAIASGRGRVVEALAPSRQRA